MWGRGAGPPRDKVTKAHLAVSLGPLLCSFQGRVHHYRLKEMASGFQMEGETIVHPTMASLVQTCMDADVLVCRLTVPIELKEDEDDGDDDPCSTVEDMRKAMTYLPCSK